MSFSIHPHSFLSRPLRVRSSLRLRACALLFSCYSSTAFAEEIVYDNIPVPHSFELWGTYDGENFIAQPFELGDNDAVSRVEVALARISPTQSVSGTIHFSIWDDDGQGRPGQVVKEIGTVDVTTLKNLIPPPDSTWNKLDSAVFDTLVTGLTPSESYFLVEYFGDVVDRSPKGTPVTQSNGLFNGFLSRNQGTHGAAEMLLADETPDWYSIRSDFGRRYLQMSITATLAGDFSGDRVFSATDIDMLNAEIVVGSDNPALDLTDDGVVDDADLLEWRSVAASRNGFNEPYLLGDSDLDGVVDAVDLNNLALNWRQNVATWSQGDFTADGVVDSADLNALAVNWARSITIASAISAPVPEPSPWLLAVFGLPLVLRRTS